MHSMGDLKQMLPPYLTDPYLTKLHTSRERLVAYVYMYVCRDKMAKFNGFVS